MMMKHRSGTNVDWTPDLINEFRDLIEEGLGVRLLAAHFGVHKNSISLLLKKLNLKTKGKYFGVDTKIDDRLRARDKAASYQSYLKLVDFYKVRGKVPDIKWNPVTGEVTSSIRINGKPNNSKNAVSFRAREAA